MPKPPITIECDPDDLRQWTDERLAMLWHLTQANPADGFRDSRPGELAMKVGWEIIRRWLAKAPVAMYHHQQSHYHHWQLGRFALYRPGKEEFHAGHYEPRMIPDTTQLRDALAAKLEEMGVWARLDRYGNQQSHRQIAQELARIVLPGPDQAGQDQAGQPGDPGGAGQAIRPGTSDDGGHTA